MTLEEAMHFEVLTGLSPERCGEIIGALIDKGSDTGNIEAIEKGIRLANQELETDIPLLWKASFYYFSANGWSSLQQLKHPAGPGLKFDLELNELSQEMICLRKALVIGDQLEDGTNILLAQILTNLGNVMNHLGRFVEAIGFWYRAMTVVPDFGMATVNLGHGLAHYARLIYDEGHQFIFSKFAYYYLLKGITSNDVYPAAKKGMSETAAHLARRFGHDNLMGKLDVKEYSFGRSELEKKYRRWCMKESLFLNPLNDFLHHSVVAHDVLCLPTIVAGLEDPPLYHTMYNQLKQEFVTARFLYFEGISSERAHFADKGNSLTDTAEYALYSLGIEKIKIAYRLCYSLFDKIAYLLNDYLEVNLPPGKVSFRNVWFQKDGTLNPKLAESQNWALRGIYWMSKDLSDKDSSFTEAILPEAGQLVTIRNFIEHKSIIAVEYGTTGLAKDGLTFTITRQDLMQKTIVLMKMVRAAIIYLPFAIHIEEKKQPSRNTYLSFFPKIDDRNKK